MSVVWDSSSAEVSECVWLHTQCPYMARGFDVGTQLHYDHVYHCNIAMFMILFASISSNTSIVGSTISHRIDSEIVIIYIVVR